jgi:hypothetical protein
MYNLNVGAAFYHNSLLAIFLTQKGGMLFCELYGDVSTPALSKTKDLIVSYIPQWRHTRSNLSMVLFVYRPVFQKCNTAKLYLALYTFKLVIRINPCVLGAPCMWVVDGHLNRVQISFS